MYKKIYIVEDFVAKRLWEKTYLFPAIGHLFGRGGEREREIYVYYIENENITLDDRIKKPLNLPSVCVYIPGR